MEEYSKIKLTDEQIKNMKFVKLIFTNEKTNIEIILNIKQMKLIQKTIGIQMKKDIKWEDLILLQKKKQLDR